jgi:hypothetical protein
MAIVISVHGTFAHVETDPGEAAPQPPWWQPDSTFANDVRAWVEAGDEPIEVTYFRWSGDNSEIARRAAGLDLYRLLRKLEAQKATYCLVGHSHGGGVISTALLEAASRKQPLDGLKKWITIGTPFVQLRKERLLFTRLDLLRKVIFVASLMLLLMFAVYLVAELASGSERTLFGGNFRGVLVVTAAMMSLPAIVFYLLLRYLDYRSHLLHRRRVRARAQASFAAKWVPLTHAEDEAVQGLALLPGARLTFFDTTFAVSAITMLSVITLPLIYLLILTSPTIMTGLGNWLKTNVYEARSSPEVETALRDLRQRLRDARQSAKDGTGTFDGKRQAAWHDYRTTRRALEAKHPEFRSAERALRFKQRFFEREGEPCEGGQLCGGGHDLRYNAGLLLHVVTDELSWVLGAEETTDWRGRAAASLAGPTVLVPMVFGIIAFVLMLIIRAVALQISRFSSDVLNRLTSAEVKRAAFGNDTEGEIALGAADRPAWIDRPRARLPMAVADLITAYSNGIAGESLLRIRRAIGQIASAGPQYRPESALTNYLTWKELVHGAYFDVPEFRKLVAQAVARAEGFAPSARFRADPQFAATSQWLAEIDTVPDAPKAPDAVEPGPEDAAAVSTVVASTVKAEP